LDGWTGRDSVLICPIIKQLQQHLFNGFVSRTTWVSQYQKGKTRLDLNEARDDGVLA